MALTSAPDLDRTEESDRGIAFKMRDRQSVVSCFVTKGALRHRAIENGRPGDSLVEAFDRYRKEVEFSAAWLYAGGKRKPIVSKADLI